MSDDKIKMYKGDRTITPSIDTKAAWEAKGWSDSKEPKKTAKKKTTKKKWSDDE